VSIREPQKLAEPAPQKRPDRIFVAPFTFNTESVRVDRKGEDLGAFKKDLQERIGRHLVERLSKHVAPSEMVAPGAPLLQGNYWLITGHFDRINQGSRILRALVGLGAGGTKMETTVLVWDLSHRHAKPFLKIQTTGGSNISPGVGGVATFFVSGPMALTNLFNVVDGVRSGVSFDAMRTAREVNAAVSEYLVQQGAIEKRKAVKPKRLGTYPNRFAPKDRRNIEVTPAPAG